MLSLAFDLVQPQNIFYKTEWASSSVNKAARCPTLPPGQPRSVRQVSLVMPSLGGVLPAVCFLARLFRQPPPGQSAVTDLRVE
ncbi:hypothetical protein RRG08_034242 [Elysia crispata]|uniref:Uncharacterized protein n=1 Tax=Elysia crispata TaxID=231223 RepID=A0AAE1DQ52_9GAST|nr:hypothetical protein RRG08_034242 [Elysia crispata]